METKEQKTTEQKVKEQIIIKKNDVDLFKALEQTNKDNAVYKTARAKGNKYNYPKELQDLKSKDKRKSSFRHSIQKNLLTFLSIDNPTKENLNSFQNFINTFFISPVKIKDCKDINEIYSFKDENQKEKESCLLILNKYKVL